MSTTSAMRSTIPENIFSTVYYQFAFNFIYRAYITDIQNYVIVIFPVAGHQAEFVLPVGEPNYSQSYNFSADNHIFSPGNNCIPVDSLQQDHRPRRQGVPHGTSHVTHGKVALTRLRDDQAALSLEVGDVRDGLFDIHIIKRYLGAPILPCR